MNVVARPVEARIVERGSRFLASLAPTIDVAGAQAHRDRRASLHTDATHHCWAYRLWSSGTLSRAGFDAGEPGGTAGRPILRALERADVVDATCVVTRWFGGTKLGTGGLTRAYAAAARAAADQARETGDLRPARVEAVLRIRHAYDLTAAVQRAVAAEHARQLEATYGDVVVIEFAVPVERAAPLEAMIRDGTGGGAQVEHVGQRLGCVDRS